jgi:large subunit ribosomal protein L21
MFAVIKTGGKQYKVEKGQTLEIERLDSEQGSTITFDDILLIGEGESTKVGTPNVEGASVSGKIVDHIRGEKIRVFKMKAKKRYQKTQGHRQELTVVEITDIKESGAKKAAKAKTETTTAEESTTEE